MRERGPYTDGRGSSPKLGDDSGTMRVNEISARSQSTRCSSTRPSVRRLGTGKDLCFDGGDKTHESTRGSNLHEDELREHFDSLEDFVSFVSALPSNFKQQQDRGHRQLSSFSAAQFDNLSINVYNKLQALRRAGDFHAPKSPQNTLNLKKIQAEQQPLWPDYELIQDATDLYYELGRRLRNIISSTVPPGNSSTSTRGELVSLNEVPAPDKLPARRQTTIQRPSCGNSVCDESAAKDICDISPVPSLPDDDFAGQDHERHLDYTPSPSDSIYNMPEMETDDQDTTSESNIKFIESPKTYQAEIGKLGEFWQQIWTDKGDDTAEEDESNSVLDSEWSQAGEGSLGQLALAPENKFASPRDVGKPMEDRLNDACAAQGRQTSAKPESTVQQESDPIEESLLGQGEETDEAYCETQAFLQEMEDITQNTIAAYQQKLELEQVIEDLELQVQECREHAASLHAWHTSGHSAVGS